LHRPRHRSRERCGACANRKPLVESGQWLLYRYDPDARLPGENPLQLDSQAAKTKVAEFLMSENRFKMLTKSKPEDAKRFFEQAQRDAEARWQLFAYLAARKTGRQRQPRGAAAPAAAPEPLGDPRRS
jgi:pyruvate-ferredoxin/flavodoxin oxidoreductase